MRGRCINPKDKAYKDYGARGITVCEEWLNVSNFIAWCEMTHPNIEGYTLDRIDNDKGYSPENCTWSDKTTQAINQRIQKIIHRDLWVLFGIPLVIGGWLVLI